MLRSKKQLRAHRVPLRQGERSVAAGELLPYENAINNFPPQRLPSGNWALLVAIPASTSRSDRRLPNRSTAGGRSLSCSRRSEVPPDEPIFCCCPAANSTLCSVTGGHRCTTLPRPHATKARTWTTPALTNFPNATNKLFSLQTSRLRVQSLNARRKSAPRNPPRRQPLTAARSRGSRDWMSPSPPSIPQDVARITKKFSAGIASPAIPARHRGTTADC